MIHQLPFIKKVEAIDAYHLVHCDIIKDRGVLLNVTQIFEEIPLIGFASCEISDKIENNTRIFSIKLQIHSTSALTVSDRNLCFRLTTVTGSQFLLGCYDKPYPTVTNEQSYPSAATGHSGNIITATLNSTLPLLAILD